MNNNRYILLAFRKNKEDETMKKKQDSNKYQVTSSNDIDTILNKHKEKKERDIMYSK